MAVTATPALPQAPKRWGVQILPADTTSLKTLVTGGANGTKVVAVIASSSDSAARDVQIGIESGSTFLPLHTVTVPITAGQIAATAAVNLLDVARIPGLPLDSDGNPFIFLSGSSETLRVKSLATVTAAKSIDINAFGADF